MDRVLHIKTFGMKIKFTEKAGARVTWMNRCQQVGIDKISFSMGDLRDALHTLWERCQDRLTKQLIFLLRNYASLECDAFPQITQIAACCTCGTHRIP